jgi:hypothetical protein
MSEVNKLPKVERRYPLYPRWRAPVMRAATFARANDGGLHDGIRWVRAPGALGWM